MKGITKIIIAAGVVAAGVGSFIFLNPNSNSQRIEEAISTLPTTFSSVKADKAPDFNHLILTTATPLALTQDGKLVNYAAKSVDTSSDGKKITITLKDGLKYEDNTDVVAQDYKTAAELLANPATKASYASWVSNFIVGGKDYFEGKTKNLSGIKVLSKTKYEINLNSNYNFFKSTLSSGIWAPIKKSQIEKVGIEKYGSNYKDVLSSGEYKVSKFSKSQYIEYTRNDASSLTTKSIPKIIRTTSYPQPDILATQFKNKKVNSIGKTATTDKILGYSKDKKPSYQYLSPTMSYLANGGLDKNTMKALWYAIDRKYIIDTFMYGNAQVRNYLTPQYYEIEAQYKNANANNYDLEKAKKLKSPSVKEINFQVLSEDVASASGQAEVKYFISQWEKLGLKVNLIKKPFAAAETMAPNTKQRSYDVTWVAWGQDYPHPQAYYGALLGTNTSTAYSYWNNDKIKEYDALIKQANEQKDDKKANEFYIKAHELQMEEGQLLPLWESQTSKYVAKNGWRLTSNGEYLRPVFWTQFK